MTPHPSATVMIQPEPPRANAATTAVARMSPHIFATYEW
jgi:hypothetical protein